MTPATARLVAKRLPKKQKSCKPEDCVQKAKTQEYPTISLRAGRYIMPIIDPENDGGPLK
jgi:hypothetical protein